MFAEWNDRTLAAVERQPQTSHRQGRYSYQTPASLVGMVYRIPDRWRLELPAHLSMLTSSELITLNCIVLAQYTITFLSKPPKLFVSSLVLSRLDCLDDLSLSKQTSEGSEQCSPYVSSWKILGQNASHHSCIGFQSMLESKAPSNWPNSKHWFTTSFLQPLSYLVTP